MKNIKYVVGGSALLGIISLFLKWVSIDGSLGGALGSLVDALPTSGMGNGGPVFLFLLALPLVAAAVGAARRFGRGLSITALLGAVGAWLLAMVKLSDISHAGETLSQLGGQITTSAAGGFYAFLLATTVAVLASFAGIVKPEPKVAAAR
jgi:hypothetical protein